MSARSIWPYDEILASGFHDFFRDDSHFVGD